MSQAGLKLLASCDPPASALDAYLAHFFASFNSFLTFILNEAHTANPFKIVAPPSALLVFPSPTEHGHGVIDLPWSPSVTCVTSSQSTFHILKIIMLSHYVTLNC